MNALGKLMLLTMFFTVNASAQSLKDDNYATVLLRNMNVNYISLPDSFAANKSTLSNYSSVNFIDARFDSTYIGYIKDGRHKRLALKNGLSNTLNLQFNNGTTRQNKDYSLLFIIHQFRLIESDTSIDKDMKKISRVNKLIVKFDVFVERQNKYQAAFRYDTTLYDFENSSTNKLPIINTCIAKLLPKIGSINLLKVATKKEYSLTDIKESITEKFNLPIVKDSLAKKGVYLTYEEFIHNSPSIIDYKLETVKSVTIISTKDDSGNWMPQQIFFGYSNGKNIWLKVYNNFFMLRRKDQSYEFFGFHFTKTKTHSVLPPSIPYNSIDLSTSAKESATRQVIGDNMYNELNKPDFQPFFIDFESGVLY